MSNVWEPTEQELISQAGRWVQGEIGIREARMSDVGNLSNARKEYVLQTVQLQTDQTAQALRESVAVSRRRGFKAPRVQVQTDCEHLSTEAQLRVYEARAKAAELIRGIMQ